MPLHFPAFYLLFLDAHVVGRLAAFWLLTSGYRRQLIPIRRWHLRHLHFALRHLPTTYQFALLLPCTAYAAQVACLILTRQQTNIVVHCHHFSVCGLPDVDATCSPLCHLGFFHHAWPLRTRQLSTYSPRLSPLFFIYTTATATSPHYSYRSTDAARNLL